MPFWAYWSSHGLDFDGRRGISAPESLALFGLPLSEPAMETNAAGDTVLTQWFERARFEDHGAKGVLLGLLGSEVSAGRRGEAAFLPVVAPLDPGAFDATAWAIALVERTNQERTKIGMPPLQHNAALQDFANQVAREWTDAVNAGGLPAGQPVTTRANEQLAQIGLLSTLRDQA